MAYLDGTSALISAVITDLGKTILAQSPAKFKIVKYNFSDDEIDYTQSTSSITATPIPEPNVASTATSEYIKTLEEGTSRILTIVPSQEKITIAINSSANCTLETDLITEELGYAIYCPTKNIQLSPIDSVIKQQEALLVSNNIINKLANTDNIKNEKYTEIEKVFEYHSIICKTAFEIIASSIIGRYIITIIGLTSKSKKEIEIFVKV